MGRHLSHGIGGFYSLCLTKQGRASYRDEKPLKLDLAQSNYEGLLYKMSKGLSTKDVASVYRSVTKDKIRKQVINDLKLSVR